MPFVNYLIEFELKFMRRWIIIYPKGDNSDHFLIYLGAAHVAGLPDGWTRHAKFSLSVISEVDKYTIREGNVVVLKDTLFRRNAGVIVWLFRILQKPSTCSMQARKVGVFLFSCLLAIYATLIFVILLKTRARLERRYRDYLV